MFTEPMQFILFLEDLPDPRQDAKVLYLLPEMIFMAVCCTVAACDDWVEVADHAEENIDWFRKYLALPNGVPSHDTFSRPLAGWILSHWPNVWPGLSSHSS